MEIETDNLWKLKVLELVGKRFGDDYFVGISRNSPCRGWDITVIDPLCTITRRIILADDLLREPLDLEGVLEKAISILVKAKPPKNVIGSVEL